MPSVPIAIRRVALLLGTAAGSVASGPLLALRGPRANRDAGEAKELLAEPARTAVLVDVRTPDEFEAHHLEAAANWPLAEICRADFRRRGARAFPRQAVALALRQRHPAARWPAGRLRELGVQDVANVDGGLQTWIASAEKPARWRLCRLTLASGQTAGLPFRESPWLEQWAVVLTGFVRQAVVHDPRLGAGRGPVAAEVGGPGGPALGDAGCFFVGENCCAANYLIFNDRSAPVRVPAQLWGWSSALA